MLTTAGAKLLDFGLAKPVSPLASGMTLTAETPRAAMTEEGAIVGTFQYMSPEQVEGKELDGRSDIFSLGAVLYEIVTGQRAFEGKSQLSVASAILEKEPSPITAVKPMTPPTLDHAIRRCLAKEPERRWQSAADLAGELQWIAEGASQVSSAPVGPARAIRPLGPRTLFFGLGTLALGALMAGLAAWNLKPSPPRPVSRTVITLPPGQRLAGLDQPAVALSPDGTHLAYVATQGGAQQIYLRAMDSLEARPIPDTEGATNPFFSPEGQWLGFFASNKLKKVPVNGGAALSIGDTTFPGGASWARGGMIAFVPAWSAPLREVPEAGGAPQPLTRFEKREFSHRWPEFLPGGKGLLFVAAEASFDWTNAQVAVQTKAGERRNLIQGATQPHYASSGHLLYAQGGSLMAVPFDPQRLEVVGAAVPVVEGVLQSRTTGAAQYSLSATGSLVYVTGGVQEDQHRLVWVNRNGAEQPVAAPAHAYMFPRLSPDGHRVSVVISEQGVQVWLYDLSRETLTRFTFEGNRNINSAWTPDGKRIAFLSNKDGPQNIFWQLSDGSGGLERLTDGEYAQVPMSWSPDGQLLAFMENNPTTGYDLWVLRMSDRKAQPFLRTPFNESVPRFSPDGHWLAYISNESGRYEIYVQPYPGPGGKWQISTEGGTEPAWNPNGRELFYRSGDKMMAVDIATQPGFTVGKPRALFAGWYEATPATFSNYDVTPDGQRFLMLKRNEQEASAPTQINVVLNWFEDLKRRVPTNRK